MDKDSDDEKGPSYTNKGLEAFLNKWKADSVFIIYF